MKTRNHFLYKLLLIILFMSTSFLALAQKDGIRITFNGSNLITKGDTVHLFLSDYRGDLQWQKSSDNKNWMDIEGQNTEVLSCRIDTNLFFRVRMKEENCDLAYSDAASFITSTNVALPQIVTSSISNVSETSASGGGIITSNGGASVTDMGVCWNETGTPTTSNNKTTDCSGTGAFISSMIGLKAATPYYVRAYATNSIGTAFGEEKQFTTNNAVGLAHVTTVNITDVTENSAMAGGNVISDGGAAVTTRGVCWSTGLNPSITSNNRTIDGTGVGLFSSSLIDLTPNTTIYLRAYASNSIGTSYGDLVSFKTLHNFFAPTVTSVGISGITQTTAIAGGNVTSDGGANITARGVCWSTSTNPTISDSKTSDGTGTGTFVSSIIGLVANTIYYVRAYAINSVGTSYGDQVSFTTSNENTGTFTDVRDNKVYNWKKFDTKTWMVENLAFLPSVSPSKSYSSSIQCYYVYDVEDTIVSDAKLLSKYKTYGVLYNWPAAKTVCPSGWHLPSDTEWTVLEEFLGSPAGGKMKETGLAHWQSPNTGGSNTSGFNVLPGGYLRAYGGGFMELGSISVFWSSSEQQYIGPWCRLLNYSSADLIRQSESKNSGFSIRCVKD